MYVKWKNWECVNIGNERWKSLAGFIYPIDDEWKKSPPKKMVTICEI